MCIYLCTGAPKYIKQVSTDLKREKDNKTIIVEDFNTPLTSMDTSPRQKINETLALNNILEPMDLTEIHRIFHSKAGCMFSSSIQLPQVKALCSRGPRTQPHRPVQWH